MSSHYIETSSYTLECVLCRWNSHARNSPLDLNGQWEKNRANPKHIANDSFIWNLSRIHSVRKSSSWKLLWPFALRSLSLDFLNDNLYKPKYVSNLVSGFDLKMNSRIEIHLKFWLFWSNFSVLIKIKSSQNCIFRSMHTIVHAFIICCFLKFNKCFGFAWKIVEFNGVMNISAFIIIKSKIFQ